MRAAGMQRPNFSVQPRTAAEHLHDKPRAQETYEFVVDM